jgi:hypothetical protein
MRQMGFVRFLLIVVAAAIPAFPDAPVPAQ